LKRVLLTGADGYIGRHMPGDLAARGYQVHAVSRTSKADTPGISWHAANLLDDAETQSLLSSVRATHLVHLAWVTEPGVYWQSPLNDDWLRASTALIEGFAEAGGTRAVLAGTCAEYDWADGHCVEDLTPLSGQSRYATAKLALRDAATALAKRSSFRFAWARIFFSFGPFEQPERLVPAVIRALLEGERARCSDPGLLRDFMYAPDVAHAISAVLDSDFTGDINIASGRPLTLEQLVGAIAAKLGGSDRIDFGHYPRRPDDPDRITADTSRLNDVIGWTPAYDLDTALEHTIAWWQEQAR